jgi:hypothetical protein
MRAGCGVLVLFGVTLSSCDYRGVTVYPTERRGAEVVALNAETFYPLVGVQDVLRYDSYGKLVSLTKDQSLSCKVAGRYDWECSRFGEFKSGWKGEGYAMRRGKMSSWFYDVDEPEYVSWWRWKRLRAQRRD